MPVRPARRGPTLVMPLVLCTSIVAAVILAIAVYLLRAAKQRREASINADPSATQPLNPTA